MRFKNMVVISVVVLFIFSIQMSCSSKKGQSADQMKERIQRDVERAKKSRQDSPDGGAAQEKQMAVADACSDKYNSCLANCNNSSCENQCLNALSDCEKDLPENLKTVKE
jgi:hypothetical protein